MTPVETVIAKLPDAKPAGAGKWQARCPAHDDKHPSLSISEGEGGRALLHCHAGCATESIVAELNLQMRDLMPPNGNGHRAAQWGKIVATYPYTDETGKILFEVVRYHPKDFRQRRPDGAGGWTWKLGDARRVLYRLPELLSAGADSLIFIVEGEKDVDSLRAAGLVATSNSGGAGKMGHTNTTPLHGRHVVVVPDADSPGRAHAQDVAARLHGKAATVRVLELPGAEKDVTDWLAAGGDGEELVRLAEAAPIWTPGQPAACANEAPDAAAQPPGNGSARELVVICAADVVRKPIHWLWPGRIPLSKLTVLAGDPKLGKSLVTVDLAARVSNGKGWPDDPYTKQEPGGVVLISAEDDPADTICPRLDAAGADSKRIRLAMMVRAINPETGATLERVFTLADVPELERVIVDTPGCRLVVIDPVSAFMGEADSYINAEVRGVLAPLAALAAKHGVAIVAVQHLNKATGGPAMYRSMGSIGMVAAARSVLAVCKDKINPRLRLLLAVGGNLAADAPGLAYTVEATQGGVPYLAWSAQPIEITADDALAPPDTRPGPDADEMDRASAWLRKVLASGPRLASELIEEAKEAESIAKRTLDRARQDIGVTAYREKVPGSWWWALQGCQGASNGHIHAELGNLGNVAENKGFAGGADPKVAKLIGTGDTWSDGSPITVPPNVPTEPDWGAA